MSADPKLNRDKALESPFAWRLSRIFADVMERVFSRSGTFDNQVVVK